MYLIVFFSHFSSNVVCSIAAGLASVILYIIFSYSSFNYITYNYYVIRKKNILINYTLFLDTGYCNNDYFVNLLKQIILI